MRHRKAPPSIDISILAGDASVGYALFDYGLTLNITEEELMERFKRGDDSRSSQGSGLGLSITKSLIENQHGKFEINIDGDLFKSIIYLPVVKETI